MNTLETWLFEKSAWPKIEIVDTNDGGQTIYRGKPATSSGDPDKAEWCIRKTIITNDNGTQEITDLYADGDINFDNVWTDRATLTYLYLK